MGKKLLSPPLTGFKDSSAKSGEPLWQGTMSYKPRTPLGQKLLRIRERMIASGERLLSWDEIEQEIAAQYENVGSWGQACNIAKESK